MIRTWYCWLEEGVNAATTYAGVEWSLIPATVSGAKEEGGRTPVLGGGEDYARRACGGEWYGHEQCDREEHGERGGEGERGGIATPRLCELYMASKSWPPRIAGQAAPASVSKTAAPPRDNSLMFIPKAARHQLRPHHTRWLVARCRVSQGTSYHCPRLPLDLDEPCWNGRGRHVCLFTTAVEWLQSLRVHGRVGGAGGYVRRRSACNVVMSLRWPLDDCTARGLEEMPAATVEVASVGSLLVARRGEAHPPGLPGSLRGTTSPDSEHHIQIP